MARRVTEVLMSHFQIKTDIDSTIKVEGSSSKKQDLPGTDMSSQNESSFSSKSEIEDTLCEINTIDKPCLPETAVIQQINSLNIKNGASDIVSETDKVSNEKKSAKKQKKSTISEVKCNKKAKYLDFVTTDIDDLEKTGVSPKSLKYREPTVGASKQIENASKYFADKTASKSKSSKSYEASNANQKGKDSKSKDKKREKSSLSIIPLNKDGEKPVLRRPRRERMAPLESWRSERRILGYKKVKTVKIGFVQGFQADKSREKLRKQKQKAAAEPKKSEQKAPIDDVSTDLELVQRNINKLRVSNP